MRKLEWADVLLQITHGRRYVVGEQVALPILQLQTPGEEKAHRSRKFCQALERHLSSSSGRVIFTRQSRGEEACPCKRLFLCINFIRDYASFYLSSFTLDESFNYQLSLM